MNVYAFYEPINESWVNTHDQEKLIELWKKSWTRYGWNPIIIDLQDAKESEIYTEFYNKVESFPTVCPKIYDMYCFLRWLSFKKYGGWMSAVSVMNYGFLPFDGKDEVITSRSVPLLVPTSAIHLPKSKIDFVIDCILNYDLKETDSISVDGMDMPHISDMIILNKNFKISNMIEKTLSISESYGHIGDLNEFDLVHYPFPTGGPHKTRTQVILEDIRWKNI